MTAGRRAAVVLALTTALAATALAEPAAPAPTRDGPSTPGAAAADTAGGPVVLARGWPVMGTLLELTAVAPDSGRARDALSAGRAEVVRLDSLLSTYRRTSEILRLNRRAGSGRWTRLSPSTAGALREALLWAERTASAVDPTVGPLVEAWGFRGPQPGVPDAAVLDSARRLVDWRDVELEEGGRRARLPRPGMRLDFGAVGKGLALEEAVDAMRAAGAVGGMADLGGQVSVFGRPPGDASRWRLGIRHPRADGRPFGTLPVDSGSVATSGDAEQFFVGDGGTRYSHIMDPREGRPARGVAQVTVVADDGSTADALATALFVLGPERGRAWLRSRDRLGRGEGQLRLVLWVRDPGKRPVCPEHVVRVGPDAAGVELDFADACRHPSGRSG